ncbi:hypothetical protein LCGC14_2924630, partial [marine sediment metagenome]
MAIIVFFLWPLWLASWLGDNDHNMWTVFVGFSGEILWLLALLRFADVLWGATWGLG